MNQYRLTGNYGTFEIQRIIHAEDADTARKSTGIMMDLESVGWTIVSSPDGEEWTIEAWDSDVASWRDVDDDDPWYVPTHESRSDSSQAMLLAILGGSPPVGHFMNEAGEKFHDTMWGWVPIETEETP